MWRGDRVEVMAEDARTGEGVWLAATVVRTGDGWAEVLVAPPIGEIAIVDPTDPKQIRAVAS